MNRGFKKNKKFPKTVPDGPPPDPPTFGSSPHDASRRLSSSSNDFRNMNFEREHNPSDFRLYARPDMDPNLLPSPWRHLDWDTRHEMKERLRRFQISSQYVKCLRLLVHGPVGAGKSSFINSIDSIFQERMTSSALVGRGTACSFTKRFQIFHINDQSHESFLPFALCDIMGLEDGQSEGVETHDLISVLQGHIRDGYLFNPVGRCPELHPHYNSSPSLGDRIHCLVSVVPASTITIMNDAVIDKMRAVRDKASNEGIPQVALLTKVEEMCPLVEDNIKQIYRSKKIKEKMEECSNRLGIPMNCIFPVKNYSEEIDLNDEVDVLLLSALKHILNYANDHVAKMAPPPANMRSSRHQHVHFEDSSVEHDHPVNRRSSRHGLCMDTEDSMMEHGHPVNMRRSRHGQYTGSEDSSMEHDINLRDSEPQQTPHQQRPVPAPRRKPPLSHPRNQAYY